MPMARSLCFGPVSAPGPVCGPVRFRLWVTFLCAVLVAAFIGWLAVLSRGGEQLDHLRFPGESAGRMLDRHLEFYEGYDQVPAWERAFFTLLFGHRAQVQHQAIDAYREVLRYFHEHPDDASPEPLRNTRARLLVLLAETGQYHALAQELRGYDATLDGEVIGEAVRYAYLQPPPGVSRAEILYGARLLPLGWAADRLQLRLAEKMDNPRLAAHTRDRLLDQGARWRERVLMLAAAVAAVVVLGIFVLLRLRRLEKPHAWDGRPCAPWSLTEGFAVLVRAGVLGLAISAALAYLGGSYFQPGVLALWSTLVASLPMLWMIHHYLLRPRGLSLAAVFGLRVQGVGPWRFLKIVASLLTVEWAGTMLIAWGTWQLGLHAHWSEGLYERVIFGPWQTAVLSTLNLALWAPLFEEIGFRGLVYGSLRTRFNVRTAMVASAVIFSALHLYSLTGFLSVFWSGLVLAWAYERYRSLLPGMVVHSVGNLMAMSTVLLFYR